MNNILITIKKELRSMFRDKKTLAALFIYPIMIPLMIILYGNIYDNLDTETNKHTIGIDYQISENEETIMDNLNLSYQKYDNVDQMDKDYEDKKIDAYISYNSDIKKYTIYIDTSSTSGLTVYELIDTYFKQYQTILTNDYLVNNGINLDEAYNHFSLEEVELSNNNYMITIILSISLTYIILSICIATSNMAISTTATEKENGTLETILTFPIKKNELIVGKYLSSVILGFLAALVSFILMIVSLYIGKSQYRIFETFELVISLKTVIGSLITIFAASLFIASVALLLTIFAKSYKEAQSKIGLLNMVCMVPMFVSILDIQVSQTYYLIPICNFEQVLNDLFVNNVSLINVSVVLGSTIVYTFIVLFSVLKAYNSERILFKD